MSSFRPYALEAGAGPEVVCIRANASSWQPRSLIARRSGDRRTSAPRLARSRYAARVRQCPVPHRPTWKRPPDSCADEHPAKATRAAALDSMEVRPSRIHGVSSRCAICARASRSAPMPAGTTQPAICTRRGMTDSPISLCPVRWKHDRRGAGGSAFRYCNHSCAPNVKATEEPWSNAHRKVVFRALHRIVLARRCSSNTRGSSTAMTRRTSRASVGQRHVGAWRRRARGQIWPPERRRLRRLDCGWQLWPTICMRAMGSARVR
jgi:hypothetical protein